MKLEIRNGRVVDPLAGTDMQQSVYCAAGRIVALGEAPADWHANRVIDAKGLIVAPGLVDLCARVGAPGSNVSSEIESELRAAVAGGVTRLVCPPDSSPVLDDPGDVALLRHRAQSHASAHVHPLGALTRGLAGEQLAEYGALSANGCIAFSQGHVPLQNTEVLLRAMQYAASIHVSVWLQPRDAFVGTNGVMHEGEVSTRLGLAGVSPLSETIAVRTAIALAQETGCRLHLMRLSCAQSVELVKDAKSQGGKLTCDVSASHLHLTDIDVGYFDTRMRVWPPLRSDSDRRALRAGLADGTIDAIVSDHTPVPADEKSVPFGEAQIGASALETLLCLVVKWAQEDRIPITKALACVTQHPAQITGVPQASVRVGSGADLCLFDPTAYRVIHPAEITSVSKANPFLGYELPGVNRFTIIGGRVVYEAPQVG